jgi:mRNA-degrading endonuclease RelE of RelBE toxin-antitoxin system
MAYRLSFSRQSTEHLRSFNARDRRVLLDEIHDQLSHQPDVATRNRKLLRPNPLATWELRIGDFRVYYDIRKSDDDPTVDVQAIGMKDRNVVTVGGEAYEL